MSYFGSIDHEKYSEFHKIVSDRSYNGKDFEKTVEELFGITDVPKPVKSKIHYIAWERGRAAGYAEVLNQYFELVELVGEVYASS